MTRSMAILVAAGGLFVLLLLVGAWPRLMTALLRRTLPGEASAFVTFPRRGLIQRPLLAASPNAGPCTGPAATQAEMPQVAVPTGLGEPAYLTMLVPRGYIQTHAGTAEGDSLEHLIAGWQYRGGLGEKRTLSLWIGPGTSNGYATVGAEPGTKQHRLQECVDSAGPMFLATFLLRDPRGEETHYLSAYRQVADSVWVRVLGSAATAAEVQDQARAVRSIQVH